MEMEDTYLPMMNGPWILYAARLDIELLRRCIK